jgi:hypothetical protein
MWGSASPAPRPSSVVDVSYNLGVLGLDTTPTAGEGRTQASGCLAVESGWTSSWPWKCDSVPTVRRQR